MAQYFNGTSRWRLLTYKGHMYNQPPKHPKNEWQCVIKNCHGEAITDNSEVTYVFHHDHEPNYHKIAAYFVKTKLIEWGSKNSYLPDKKQLDVIVKCLPPEVETYMDKVDIYSLIKKKRDRRLNRGEEQQQQNERFIFPMNEIKDLTVAEILVPSAIMLNNYYLKNGIIQLPNEVFDPSQLITQVPTADQLQNHQESESPEISEASIGVTVPPYASINNNMSSDNEISTTMEIDDNNNNDIQQNLHIFESNGSSTTDSDETPPILHTPSFDNDFDDDDISDNEDQDLSSSNANSNAGDTVFNADSSLFSQSISSKQMPAASCLANAKQQPQHHNLVNNINDSSPANEHFKNSITNPSPASFIESLLSKTIGQCQNKVMPNSVSSKILENIDESLGNWCKVPNNIHSDPSNSVTTHFFAESPASSSSPPPSSIIYINSGKSFLNWCPDNTLPRPLNSAKINFVNEDFEISNMAIKTANTNVTVVMEDEPITCQSSITLPRNHPSFNEIVSSNAASSTPTAAPEINETQKTALTNKFLLNILSNPDKNAMQQQLDQYQAKLIAELDETSKVVKKIFEKMTAAR